MRYCILPSAVWCRAVHTFSHTLWLTRHFTKRRTHHKHTSSLPASLPARLSPSRFCSLFYRFLVNSYPSQLVPVSTRTLFWSTRTQVNSYPCQLVPVSTRTLFGQLVPKSTRTLVNSYPSQLVPFLKHGYYGSVCYLIHLYIVASFHPPLPHHANGKGNHFRPR